MMRYSVQPRDRIFVTGCGVFSFTKNMCKNIGKNIRKNLSGKYIPDTLAMHQKLLAMCQKLLDHGKKFTIDALKNSSKRVIRRIAETNGNSIGNSIANRITRVSKISQRNNLEIVTNEHDKEIPKNRYRFPEQRQEITDELGLK